MTEPADAETLEALARDARQQAARDKEWIKRAERLIATQTELEDRVERMRDLIAVSLALADQAEAEAARQRADQ